MATNNQSKYEAILKGLRLLQEIKAEVIEILGDSQLVIKQLPGIYDCKDYILREYLDKCHLLCEEFSIVYVPRAQNMRPIHWLKVHLDIG